MTTRRTALEPFDVTADLLVIRDDKRVLRDLAQIAVRLGDPELAARVLPQAVPFNGTLMTTYDLNTCDGAAAVTIANCETALGRFDEAERHYDEGIELESSVEAWGLVANSQIFYAWMLQTRNAAHDADRAAELLGQARASAARLGMTRVADEARSLLGS